MSQPLLATARLQFLYQVSGLNHRLNMYMAYNDVLGQHQMVDRDGITTVLWTLGGQYAWDKIRAIFTAASLPAPASLSLFQRSGTLWNLIDVASLTGIGTYAGTVALASQGTWVLRDLAFKKLRFVLLELPFGYVGHFNNGLSSDGQLNAVSNMLSGADTNANAPYRWMKSRGDRFLAANGVIAGLTFDLNDKLKRARGFE